MPELASEERIAALEAENARLRAALERIHEGASRTAQDSRSRDDDRYCIADVIETSARALAGDGSALQQRLDAVREEGKQSMLCPRKAHQPYDALECPVCLAQERDSLRAQLAERDATIASLQRRIADNLCYLKPDEKLDPMLPKPIHLESCERFYDQEVGGRGVLEGCMTVAQLEEALAQSEDLFKEAEKSWSALARKFRDERDEAERKRDENLVQREDMQTKRKCDRLAAQVERLRFLLGHALDGVTWKHGPSHQLSLDITEVLAETPAASLAAVCDQARREALEDAARKAREETNMDQNSMWAGWLDGLADAMNRLTPEQAKALVPDSEWGSQFEDLAQPTKEPQP